MRSIKILIAVFAVCLMAPAFSAVENVKVGGDIAVYGVLRGDFELPSNNNIHFFQTAARVFVSADLSDNVSTMIRLINERNFGYASTGTDVNVDLAYIKVADLLTPGLTLTVGRQEIELGEGLVIGSAYSLNYPVSLAATDLGIQKAFDAVRIDYSTEAFPLNLTAFLSKINEKLTKNIGEETLYGVNIGTKVADVANIDVYYVRNLTDSSPDDKLDTAGIRVVAGIPAIEGLTLKGEYAKQFGDDGTQDYEGSALILGASYKFATSMEPTIKANYLLLSGQDSSADITAWVPVFPSNIGSRIGPLLYAYTTYEKNVGEIKKKGVDLSPGSNLSVINLGLSLKPVEKLSLTINGYMQKLEEGTPDDIGKEVDLCLEYKLTEDVTLGLELGKIFVDDVIEKNLGGKDAWQAIVSMKVAF